MLQLPAVVAKTIEFKMVQLGAAGLPELTSDGEKCFVILESGDGQVPEFSDMAAIEDQQSQLQLGVTCRPVVF